MDPQYIKQLIVKYAKRSASREEVDTLMNWYRQESNNSTPWPAESEQEQDRLHNQMLSRLKADINRSVKSAFPWLKVAAAILIVFCSAILTYYFVSQP
jgi:hypothetical protein